DQSGQFLDCPSYRCNLRQWLVSAADVQLSEGVWLLRVARSTKSIRIAGGTCDISGVSAVTLDDQGNVVSSVEIEVLSSQMEDDQLVPISVEYRGVLRRPDPERGVEVCHTKRQLRL